MQVVNANVASSPGVQRRRLERTKAFRKFSKSGERSAPFIFVERGKGWFAGRAAAQVRMERTSSRRPSRGTCARLDRSKLRRRHGKQSPGAIFCARSNQLFAGHVTECTRCRVSPSTKFGRYDRRRLNRRKDRLFIDNV